MQEGVKAQKRTDPARSQGGGGARVARRRFPPLTITGSARRLLGSSRLRDVDVSLRQTLEDFVKARRHPLRVVATVITITAVVLIGGFFLRFPPLPQLRAAFLERLRGVSLSRAQRSSLPREVYSRRQG